MGDVITGSALAGMTTDCVGPHQTTCALSADSSHEQDHLCGAGASRGSILWHLSSRLRRLQGPLDSANDLCWAFSNPHPAGIPIPRPRAKMKIAAMASDSSMSPLLPFRPVTDSRPEYTTDPRRGFAPPKGVLCACSTVASDTEAVHAQRPGVLPVAAVAVSRAGARAVGVWQCCGPSRSAVLVRRNTPRDLPHAPSHHPPRRVQVTEVGIEPTWSGP